MRIDSGWSYRIPIYQFASLAGSGGQPGIIFIGKDTPLSAFGQGKASDDPYNWAVGGTIPYPINKDIYKENHRYITSSYEYILSTAKDNLLEQVPLETYCTVGLNNCTLDPNLPKGFYVVDGDRDLTLNTYTFKDNKNYVIAVSGDLIIKGNIEVEIGSTLTFSVQGDINIDGDVGEANSSSTNTNLAGFYSTDHNFLVDDDNNPTTPDKTTCPATDKRLNIAGTVITNASLTGGRLINHRDLCNNNLTNPAIFFKERLDLILNAPRFLKREVTTYKEVPPK